LPTVNAQMQWTAVWGSVYVHLIYSFHCEVDDNCTLLGCYPASSCISKRTFRDNL